MALESSGEGRPLLESPGSPAEAPAQAVSRQLAVRWSCLEALEPPEPPPPPHQLAKPPAYSSMLSTDSGCESEGGASDSVYSTVTSCTSDLVRLQLDPLPAEGADCEESQQERPGAAPAEAVAPPPPPAEPADERRVRSWSLEARGAAEAAAEPAVGAPEAAEADLLPAPLRHSYSEPSLTTSASTASMPICRICHMPSEERAELISPCRCAGTMQYIHTACLMHWIEVSSRRSKRPPCCELCQYQYQRHKRFRVGRWIVPAVSTRDKVLHSVFILTAIVMITCAVITIFCFKQVGALLD
ncbi:E3 ubiquitin-protein ligase MARCH1 [Amphibalanus amphitrite]|uniref:E3 ubiquitin-protein ligase MARCH1 n=1 Tax=Amphibalanus amphitrite TaxID=1232801 RepID=A0A6A4VQQ1_AMPAM|nr:E3 ubiquitin-protein ligase MARCH1 [Amphibalanus amphitrite]